MYGRLWQSSYKTVWNRKIVIFELNLRAVRTFFKEGLKSSPSEKETHPLSSMFQNIDKIIMVQKRGETRQKQFILVHPPLFNYRTHPPEKMKRHGSQNGICRSTMHSKYYRMVNLRHLWNKDYSSPFYLF